MQFDEYSKNYNNVLNKGLSLSGETVDYFAEMRIIYVREYLTRMGKSIDTILEYGCGTGNNIYFLRKYFPHCQVWGVDISSESLKTAAERYVSDKLVHFQVVSKYPQSQQVDLVFVNGVFHHIPKDQQLDSLKFIQSVLKKDALLALFENNPFNPGTRWIMSRVPFDHDAVMLNPYTFKKTIGSLAFNNTRLKFYFVFPKILKFFRFLEKYLESAPSGAQYCIFTQKQ